MNALADIVKYIYSACFFRGRLKSTSSLEVREQTLGLEEYRQCARVTPNYIQSLSVRPEKDQLSLLIKVLSKETFRSHCCSSCDAFREFLLVISA